MRCVEQELSQDITSLRLVGDLDLASAPVARTRFRQMVEDGWRYVVVDLASCDFLDSVGLGVLIGMRRRISHVESPGAIVLANAAHLKRIFESAELESLFRFADSIEVATDQLETEIAMLTGTRPDEGGD